MKIVDQVEHEYWKSAGEGEQKTYQTGFVEETVVIAEGKVEKGAYKISKSVYT